MSNENQQAAQSKVATAFQNVVAMRTRPWNENMRQEIQSLFVDNEDAAVRFVWEKAIYPNSRTIGAAEEAASRVMIALEKPTLSYSQSILKLNKTIDVDHRRTLTWWAWGVRAPRSLVFVIDLLIDDKELLQVPDPHLEGPPLRFCDGAFNLAVRRIVGFPNAGEKYWERELTEMTPTQLRDEELKKFRPWWNQNKARLQWSEQAGRFVIGQ